MNIEMQEEIEKELESAMTEGPTFGQSIFQLEKFVVGGEKTPRAYRQVLLEMSMKINDLKKCRTNRKRLNAKLSILEEKLTREKNEHERTILECDVEDIENDLLHQEKLILDATKYCNHLYAIFKSFPKFTEIEFEKAEDHYWKERICREAQLGMLSGAMPPGHAETLAKLGMNPITAQLEMIEDTHTVQKTFIESKNSGKLGVVTRLEKKS